MEGTVVWSWGRMRGKKQSCFPVRAETQRGYLKLCCDALLFAPTKQQEADAFTKSLGEQIFGRMVTLEEI